MFPRDNLADGFGNFDRAQIVGHLVVVLSLINELKVKVRIQESDSRHSGHYLCKGLSNAYPLSTQERSKGKWMSFLISVIKSEGVESVRLIPELVVSVHCSQVNVEGLILVELILADLAIFTEAHACSDCYGRLKS